MHAVQARRLFLSEKRTACRRDARFFRFPPFRGPSACFRDLPSGHQPAEPGPPEKDKGRGKPLPRLEVNRIIGLKVNGIWIVVRSKRHSPFPKGKLAGGLIGDRESMFLAGKTRDRGSARPRIPYPRIS